MIPTQHLRYVMRSTGDNRPELQQLWVPLKSDETLFYPLSHLEASGGEWRPIPIVQGWA